MRMNSKAPLMYWIDVIYHQSCLLFITRHVLQDALIYILFSCQAKGTLSACNVGIVPLSIMTACQSQQKLNSWMKR